MSSGQGLFPVQSRLPARMVSERGSHGEQNVRGRVALEGAEGPCAPGNFLLFWNIQIPGSFPRLTQDGREAHTPWDDATSRVPAPSCQMPQIPSRVCQAPGGWQEPLLCIPHPRLPSGCLWFGPNNKPLPSEAPPSPHRGLLLPGLLSSQAPPDCPSWQEQMTSVRQAWQRRPREGSPAGQCGLGVAFPSGQQKKLPS